MLSAKAVPLFSWRYVTAAQGKAFSFDKGFGAISQVLFHATFHERRNWFAVGLMIALEKNFYGFCVGMRWTNNGRAGQRCNLWNKQRRVESSRNFKLYGSSRVTEIKKKSNSGQKLIRCDIKVI
jgi:hypothetical protein